jgi:hypothetical protein
MADKLLELYSKMPKGYFKDEEEFKTYASDPANYDDIFDIVKDSGDFTSKEEMVSYISPDVKKKENTDSGFSSGESQLPSQVEAPIVSEEIVEPVGPEQIETPFAPTGETGTTGSTGTIETIKTFEEEPVGPPQTETPPVDTGATGATGTVKTVKEGYREDGTKKGPGWVPGVKTSKGKALDTEYPVAVLLDNKKVYIPLLVPTLTKAEMDWLGDGGDINDGSSTANSIFNKAAKYAESRIVDNKSPFASKEDVVAGPQRPAATPASSGASWPGLANIDMATGRPINEAESTSTVSQIELDPKTGKPLPSTPKQTNVTGKLARIKKISEADALAKTPKSVMAKQSEEDATAWGQVTTDVKSKGYDNTQDYFDEQWAPYASKALTEDQLEEYSFVKKLGDIKKKLEELEPYISGSKVSAKGGSFISPQGQKTIVDEYQALLSEKTQIEFQYQKYVKDMNTKIDAQIADLRQSGLAANDYRILNLQAQKERFLKNPSEIVESVAKENQSAIEKFSVPGKTSQEKLVNLYLLLEKKQSALETKMPQSLLDNIAATFPKFDPINTISNLFGGGDVNWGEYEKFRPYFGANKELQKVMDDYVAITKQMSTIAPVLLINRTPIEKDRYGALASTTGFISDVFDKYRAQVTEQGALVTMTDKDAVSYLQSGLAEANIQLDEINKSQNKNINAVAKYEAPIASLEFASDVLAGSLAAGTFVALGAAAIEMAPGLSTVELEATLEAYKATKTGRWIARGVKAAKGGLTYEVAGKIAPEFSSVKEELHFFAGVLGFAGEAAVGKVINKKNLVNTFSYLFGKNLEKAMQITVKMGQFIGAGVAETGQEYSEGFGSLIDLYAETEDVKAVTKEFEAQYGTLDKNLKIIIASTMMGGFMGMGSAFGKASVAKNKQLYSQLTPQQKATIDKISAQMVADRKASILEGKKAAIKKLGREAITPPITAQQQADKNAAVQVINDPESTKEQIQAAIKVADKVIQQDKDAKLSRQAETGVTYEEEAQLLSEDELTDLNDRKESAEAVIAQSGSGQIDLMPEVKENLQAEIAGISDQLAAHDNITQKYNDYQNKSGLSGKVGIGKEPVQAKPIEGGSAQATPTSGDVQASEKVAKSTDKILSNVSEGQKAVLGRMKGAVNQVAKSLGLNIEGKSETRAMSEAYEAALNVPSSERTKPQTDLIKAVDLAKREGAADRAAQSLKSSGVKVKFVTSEEIAKATQKRGGEAGAEGVFMSDSGEILIDRKNFEAGYGSTVIWHEASHPVLNIIRNTDSKLYGAAVRGLKAAVKANPKSGLEKVINWADREYTKDGESTLNDEKLTESIARIADGKIDLDAIPKGAKQAVIDFINKIAKALGLGQIINDTDMAKFKKLAGDIASVLTEGRDIAEVVGKENVGKYVSSIGGAQKSAVRVMQGKENMAKYGLKGNKAKTREVGEALEERQRQKYGIIGKNDRSPEAKKKISSWMMEEIEYFMEAMGENSGKGWYGEKYQKGLDAMAEIFPEMKKDQNARDLFTMLVAITSDGEKVLSNFKLAALAYSGYIESGKKTVPSSLPGMRQASFSANLSRINSLLKQYKGDIQAMKKDLLEVKSIRDINAERKVQGEKALTTSWPVDFNAPLAASVFGPKLGMFYSNLSGKEDYPTLDRWWSRTFNRYRGNVIPQIKRGFNTKGEPLGIDRIKALLKKPKMSDDNAMIAIINNRDSYAAKGFKRGTELEKAANTVYKTAFENLNDSPENKTDRQFMYDTVADAVERLNAKGYDLSIADAQAILWYFEKNLYKTLGVQAKIEGISYEDAARITVQKFKENNSLKYNIDENEDQDQIEEEDDNIEKTEDSVQESKAGGREDLQRTEKGINFETDETRKTKQTTTPAGFKVDRPVAGVSSRLDTKSGGPRGFKRRDTQEVRRIGADDVKVSTIYTPEESVKKGILKFNKNATIDKEILEISNDPEAFHKFISQAKFSNPNGASVYVYEDEQTREHQYDDMRLFVTPDGEAGVALKPNGDMVSGFASVSKTGVKKPYRIAQLLVLAIKEGALKADAFNTALPGYYSRFGFRGVAKSTFNEDYAPAAYTDKYGNKHKAWEKEQFKDYQDGLPDVVYFVYDGGDRNTIENRLGAFEPYKAYEDIVPLVGDPDEGAVLQAKALGAKPQASLAGGRGETAMVNGVEEKVKPLPGGIDIVDGFYSPLEKKIAEYKQPNASATKWKEILGTKSDESQFSGLVDWLNSKRPDEQIKKTEIQQFIKDNRIEIKEIVKENVSESEIEAFMQDEAGEGYTRDEAIEYLQSGEATKFKSYTLSGNKEDYKETLVTLPNRTKEALVARTSEVDKRLEEIDNELMDTRTYKKVGNTGTIADFELEVTNKEDFDRLTAEKNQLEKERKSNFDKIQKEKEGEFYNTKHYDEADILVHARTDIRYDSNGNKVLFVEEVQSDWGQTGRDVGFKVKSKKDQYTAQEEYDEVYKKSRVAENKLNAAMRVYRESLPNTSIADALASGDKNIKNLYEDYKTQEEKRFELLDIVRSEEKQIKAAPYVQKTNAWAKLGLKVALKEAVAAGAKSIAWTTGEQQIARYDLRKQADRVSYKQNADGTYDVNASKEGVSVGNEQNLTPKQLEGALGKDIAQRIVAGEGDASLAQGMQKDLTGEQLAFGGAGMIGFYGNETKPGIIGETAIALVEELTGKKGEIKEVAIDTAPGISKETYTVEYMPDEPLGRTWLVLDNNQGVRARETNRSDAMQSMRDLTRRSEKAKAEGMSTQASIEITPALEASVKQGMPQFSKGGRDAKVTKSDDFDMDGEYDVSYKGEKIGRMYYERTLKSWKNAEFDSSKEKAYSAKAIYGDMIGDTKEEAVNTLIERHLENKAKSEPKPVAKAPAKDISSDPVLNEYLNGLSEKGDLQRNPFNPREFIYNNAARLEFNRFDKGSRREISLQDISTISKGQGQGKATLNDITSVADDLGMKVTLDAKPFGEGGLKIRDLVKFYQNAGFKIDLSAYGGEFKTDKEMIDYAAKYSDEAIPMYRDPSTVQASKGGRDIQSTFSQATDLFYQIRETEGGAKKRRLAEERKALMDANPSVKYIDDNIKNILDQLEKNNKATRKGNCP